MIELFHNEIDISNLLISYNRQQEMCSGVGTLDLVLTDGGRAYSPWDFIELFEGGRKKGEYYIISTDDDENKGTMTISAQDGSIKLTSYFIDEQYEVEGGESARSLITMYLNMAGVVYEFTAGDGVTIGKGASFGMSSAFDAITTILQYSGWYMYFNPNNVCIVGTLDTNPGSAKLLTDATITYLKVHKNDDMLRNKAVVWGGTEYPDGGMVHVSKQVITPWNYDENDLRAVVISNGMIRDYASANTMANRLMQEFPHLTIEKEINIAGTTTFAIGDSINVDSQWWVGSGLLTTHAASFSAGDGFQTNIVLDQRCPRLFGFWKEYPIPNGPPGPDEIFDYVYVGTWGDGIWRKPINGHVWENFSDGLALERSLYIKDLFIKKGVLVCVADDNYAYMMKETDPLWRQINHGGYQDGDIYHYMPEMQAVACSINDNGTIILGINYTPELTDNPEVAGDRFSFVLGISPTSDPLSPTIIFQDRVEYIIEVEEEEDPVTVTNANIHDLEAMGSNVILSTEGWAEAYAHKRDHKFPSFSCVTGEKSIWGQEAEAINTFIPPGKHEITPPDNFSFFDDSSIITDLYDNNIIYGFRLEYFFRGNLSEKTITKFLWDIPVAWGSLAGCEFGMLRQINETEFDLIIVKGEDIYDTTEIYHTHYILGDENITTTLIREIDTMVWGQTILGNTFICNCETIVEDHFIYPSVFVYNLDTNESDVIKNEIPTHKYNSFKAPQKPHPPFSLVYEVGWVNLYELGENLMIPGNDSVTFGSVYRLHTNYDVKWSWVGFTFMGYTLLAQDYVVNTQYIKFNKLENGEVSMTQYTENTILKFQNPNNAGPGETTAHIYFEETRGASFDHSSLVASGGYIYQLQFRFNRYYIDPFNAVYHTIAVVFSLDDSLSLLGKYYSPVIEPDSSYYDDKLLIPVGVDTGWSTGTFPPSGGVPISSKYFGSKFTKYAACCNPEFNFEATVIHDLALNTCRIPYEGITPFGTEYYDLNQSEQHTINDDDNDGTIYFEATRVEDDIDILLGIEMNGASYTITKEIELEGDIGQFMAIFGDWIMRIPSTSARLTKGFSIGSPSKLLKYSPISSEGKFEVILDTGFNSTVEINKNSPIEAYHKISLRGLYSAFIYQNFAATSENWDKVYILKNPVHDLRTCDIVSPDLFTIEDGVIGNESKWGIYGTTNQLKAFPTTLAGEQVDNTIIIKTFEGSVTNVETTNYNGNPYLFVAVSGEVTIDEDIDSGIFFQRGQNSEEFMDLSSGLPSSGITIIRVDDRL